MMVITKHVHQSDRRKTMSDEIAYKTMTWWRLLVVESGLHIYRIFMVVAPLESVSKSRALPATASSDLARSHCHVSVTHGQAINTAQS